MAVGLAARHRGTRRLLAAASVTLVRIAALSAKSSIALNPGESTVHESSIAATVVAVTVNEFLFRQRPKVALHSHVTFQSSSGRESPA
jgi:hypothetical protein